MYKIITFIVLGLISWFNCDAQETNILHASGTHFAQPVKDKKWRNANTETSTAASYTSYSGLTYVTLIADRDTEAELSYSIKADSGELTMEIATDGGEPLFDKTFKASASGTTKVKLLAGVIYKINFTGNNTSGAYNVNWKAL